jgi:hypothetical protein
MAGEEQATPAAAFGQDFVPLREHDEAWLERVAVIPKIAVVIIIAETIAIVSWRLDPREHAFRCHPG